MVQEKKTILYLRTDLGTEHVQAGGSVAHTIGVIKGLQAQGYTIIAASSALFQVMHQLALKVFLPLYVPRYIRMFGFKLSCIMTNILFLYKVCVFCSASDIMCIYQRYSLLNIVGVVLSWWYKIPLVLEFNGSEVWVDEHWSKKRWLKMRWLIKWFERINLGYAQTILVVSQVLKDELIAQGISAHKILMHPNGVDVDYFNPQPLDGERERIRQSLRIQDCVVFGFIGTFSYWHGIDVLAYMIPHVVKQWPQAHFLLIGDGPLKNSLQQAVQAVSAQVHFLGTIPQSDARNYLVACDAFLLPTQPNPDGTKFFGSPTKLFEYMSLAKPIIASDIEQVADILHPALRINGCFNNIVSNRNEIGILVRPQDLASFVTAAGYVIESTKHDIVFFGNNARAKVCNYYTWQHHTQCLLNHLSGH